MGFGHKFEEIVTNSSFVGVPPVEPPSLEDYYQRSGVLENTRTYNESTLNGIIEIILTDLFPPVSFKPIPNEYASLAQIISARIKNLNCVAITAFAAQLKGHTGISDGLPWIDLDAAFILGIHPDIQQSSIARSIESPRLPIQIKNLLESGTHVPMEKIIFGMVCANNSEFQDDAEFLSKNIPDHIIKKIKHCDVLRAINAHVICLGIKYPILSLQMTQLVDGLWKFMYDYKYSAFAGIQLYNHFFIDFGKQLAAGKLVLLSHFPRDLRLKIANAFPIKNRSPNKSSSLFIGEKKRKEPW